MLRLRFSHAFVSLCVSVCVLCVVICRFWCVYLSVNLFRPDENAKRIKASAERILMEPPPPELFIKACKMAVQVGPPSSSRRVLRQR